MIAHAPVDGRECWKCMGHHQIPPIAFEITCEHVQKLFSRCQSKVGQFLTEKLSANEVYRLVQNVYSTKCVPCTSEFQLYRDFCGGGRPHAHYQLVTLSSVLFFHYENPYSIGIPRHKHLEVSNDITCIHSSLCPL